MLPRTSDTNSQLNPTRRRFLKQTATSAAAVVVAPYFVPASALSGQGRVGANDRIGVAYIGCGRRSAQLRNLPAEGQIVAAADCDIGRAKKVAAEYNGQAYRDYRELLESKDVDAVIIATPDHWHALPSIHACQAGKDVYVEKPMTLTIREGRLMVQAARKYARVVQTGSQQRSMKTNINGCRLIRDGAIGKIHTVIGFNYPSPWLCNLPAQKTPADIDWEMWCGQTELRPFHQDIYVPRGNPGWISFQQYSGGEMTGWGAHGLDQIQMAFGTDNTGPVEIWTEGGEFSPPTFGQSAPRNEAEQKTSQPSVRMRFADGAIIKLDDGPHGGAIFVGDKGRITIDRGSCKIEPAELADTFRDVDTRNSGKDTHMKNWFECMKTRSRPVADVEIGHRSATFCHLGNIARWTGERLHWDPVQEKFKDNEIANRMLSRPQRKGYEFPEI